MGDYGLPFLHKHQVICMSYIYSTELNVTTFNNGSLGFRIDEERSERAKRNVNCRIQ
jgi:hypothetical protein